MTLEYDDRIIAGGDRDFMAVRHVRLRGKDQEIGQYLARIARNELEVRKVPWTEPLVTRAQRHFIGRHWPALARRMQGVAAEYGGVLADDRLDYSFLAYDVGLPGCSCVFYPGRRTVDGHNVLSRNFDYTTGGHGDVPIANGQLDDIGQRFGSETSRPFVSRPFLLELYPETGYATLGMCAFDLLGMLTDGVNSEGLAVALLNDGETPNGPLWEPLTTHGVGLAEGQVPRFLLETCATAEEALIALLTTKQYYIAGPCHYLVGDSSGRGFVWEYSSIRNRHHVVECPGVPLPVTNHLLHEHKLLAPEAAQESIGRLQALRNGLQATPGAFDRDRIHAINASVHAVLAAGEGQYRSTTHPTRTLWQAQYDLDARRVDIDYFLGDAASGPRRSPILSFALGCDLASRP